MKRMNKQVYVAVLMALTTMSINSYAADVTMNNNEEEVTINVTANRTALLDLDTPVSTSVITQEDIQNSGAKTAFDAVANVLAQILVAWIAVRIFVASTAVHLFL